MHFCSKLYGGMAAITVDGVAYSGLVDTYAPAPGQWIVGHTISGLASGIHTVNITVSNQKNPSSTDYYIGVDAFYPY